MNKEKVKATESEIKSLDRELSLKYSEGGLKRICELKYQLNDICNKKAEYAMFRMRTAFYESGEKTGKLSARQLKQKNASFTISAIKKEKEEVVTNNFSLGEG